MNLFVTEDPLAEVLHELSLERMALYNKLHPDDGSCRCNEWAAAIRKGLENRGSAVVTAVLNR